MIPSSDINAPISKYKNNYLEYMSVGLSAHTNQHLHILTEEGIKVGDVYMDGDNNIGKCTEAEDGYPTRGIFAGSYYNENSDHPQKLIASTDKCLGLSSLSREFIKEYIDAYNAKSPIQECIVEMEEYESFFMLSSAPGDKSRQEFSLRPKINKNKEISIRRAEETWDDIFEKFNTQASGKTFPTVSDLSDWLEKNYNIPTKK